MIIRGIKMMYMPTFLPKKKQTKEEGIAQKQAALKITIGQYFFNLWQ